MDQVQARNAIAVWKSSIDALLPQANPADRHAELLAKHQVRTDSTVLWPTGLTAVLLAVRGIEPKEVTQAEATMLDDLQKHRGLVGLKEFADLRQDALNTAQGRFAGKGGTDGHADAFRHAYWNALMTQKYGEPWAAEFATAHERHPDSHHIPVAMDLHNNEVGRKIALDNPGKSPEELAVLVEQAVNRGEMVVIDQNDTLRSSNEVLAGETRPTNPDNKLPVEKPWPEHNPDRADDRDPGPPSAPLKPR